MIFDRHILQRKQVTEGYEATNGDWVEGVTSWGESIPCDAKPSKGEASTINLTNGKRTQYAYECSLDAECEAFNVGEIVRLTTEDGTHEYEVKGFHRYLTCSKVWL